MLNIDAKELKTAVNNAGKFVSPKVMFAIYLSYKLIATDKLTIQATNGDDNIAYNVDCEVTEPFECIVKSDILNAIVAKLTKPATLTLTGNHLIIKSGGAEYKLSTLEDDNNRIPELPNVDGALELFRVNTELYKTILQQVAFAGSRDMTYHFTNYVLHKEIDGTLDILATDAHRMAIWQAHRSKLADLDFNLNAEVGINKLQLLLPVELCYKLLPILTSKYTYVYTSERKLYIKTDNAIVQSMAGDINFPDHRRILLKSCTTEDYDYKTKDVSEALKRLTSLAKLYQKTPSINISNIDGQVIFTFNSDNHNSRVEAKETLDGTYKDININLNPTLLLEGVNSIISDKFGIRWVSDKDPMELNQIDELCSYKYLIMPVRV